MRYAKYKTMPSGVNRWEEDWRGRSPPRPHARPPTELWAD